MSVPSIRQHKQLDRTVRGRSERAGVEGFATAADVRLDRPSGDADFVSCSAAGIHWLMRPGFEPALYDTVLPLLEGNLASNVSRVKHGRHRSVYRVASGAGCYYVKHYRVADLRALLNAAVLGPRAYREWRRLNRALQSGLPTLVPAAVGWRRLGPVRTDSFLVTVEEPNTCQLDTLLATPAAADPRTRRAVLRQVAAVLATAHRTGLDHQDLHAGNLLVRLSGNGCEVFLIDLLATRWRNRPLPWSASVRNLLQLGVSVLKYTEPGERFAFLAHYLERRPELGRRPRDVAAAIEERLWRYARYCWWKRDEQCVGENRRFFFVYARSAHAHAVRDLPEPLVRELMANPEHLLRSGSLLKDSPSSTVVRTSVTLADGHSVPVLWKRFRCSKPLDRLRGFLYRSPGLRSWRGANALRIRGIPTPRPLLFVETRRWGIADDAYLMTEYIEGAQTLVDYVQRTLSQLDPKTRAERRWQLAEQLGQGMGQLHRCCLSHRDLKFPNWIVVSDERGRVKQIFVIDLAGLQVWKRLPWRRRVQNVARLWISAQAVAEVTPTEALRFLRAYLPNGLQGGEWKRWWRSVQAFAQRKLARNRRSGRVVT